MQYAKHKTAALVLKALRNLHPEAVKSHLLSEARRAGFKWPRPKARILAGRTTAAYFFAYFFHPRKKVGPPARGNNTTSNHRTKCGFMFST